MNFHLAKWGRQLSLRIVVIRTLLTHTRCSFKTSRFESGWTWAAQRGARGPNHEAWLGRHKAKNQVKQIFKILMWITLHASFILNLIGILELQKPREVNEKQKKIIPRLSGSHLLLVFFPSLPLISPMKHPGAIIQHSSSHINNFHTVPKITAFPSVSLMKLWCVWSSADACICAPVMWPVSYPPMPHYLHNCARHLRREPCLTLNT